MKNEINVIEWQKRFVNGDFDKNDFETQCVAGWYDWFCKTSSLGNKTKKMGNIIKKVVSGGKVDLNNCYVWFKNNCPCCYPLYDDFRFADIETNDVQMTIQIDCKYNKHKYCVFGRRGKNKEFEKGALFECDTIKELVGWLNKKWEE